MTSATTDAPDSFTSGRMASMRAFSPVMELMIGALFTSGKRRP